MHLSAASNVECIYTASSQQLHRSVRSGKEPIYYSKYNDNLWDDRGIIVRFLAGEGHLSLIRRLQISSRIHSVSDPTDTTVFLLI
jgi:hypothetical protein